MTTRGHQREDSVANMELDDQTSAAGGGGGGGGGGDDDVPRAEWLPRLMRKHPDVLELHERLRGLMNIDTFGRSLNCGRTEVKDTLSHHFVLRLVGQYLHEEGLHETLSTLTAEAKLGALTDETLHRALMLFFHCGIKDPNHILEPPASHAVEKKAGADTTVKTYDFLPSTGTSFMVDDDDVDINDEEEDNDANIMVAGRASTREGVKNIAAATLNKLVEWLTHEGNKDLTFRKTFFLTYQSFCNPEKLLEKLVQRYSLSTDDADYKKAVQIRVFMATKYWVDHHPADFRNEKLLTALNNFIDNVLSRDGHAKLAKQLRNALTKVQSRQASEIAASAAQSAEMAPEPKVPPNIFSSTLTLDQVAEEEVARQMSILDFRIYQRITNLELLNKNWARDDASFVARNVYDLMARADALSRWTAWKILNEDKVRARARQFLRNIKIAMQLKELNNFHACAAVYAGLTNASVFRLRYTLKELRDVGIKRAMDELESLFTQKRSCFNYRAALTHVRPPAVPWMAAHLRDLQIVEEANMQKVKKMINFAKRTATAKCIGETLKYQQLPYSFHYVHQIGVFIDNFVQVRDFDEDALMRLSLLREPKDATPDQIS